MTLCITRHSWHFDSTVVIYSTVQEEFSRRLWKTSIMYTTMRTKSELNDWRADSLTSEETLETILSIFVCHLAGLTWFSRSSFSFFVVQLSGWDFYIEKHPLTSVGVKQHYLLSHCPIGTGNSLNLYQIGGGTMFSGPASAISFIIIFNGSCFCGSVLLGLERSIIKLSWYHWC